MGYLKVEKRPQPMPVKMIGDSKSDVEILDRATMNFGQEPESKTTTNATTVDGVEVLDLPTMNFDAKK